MTEYSLAAKRVGEILVNGPRLTVELADELLKVIQGQPMHMEWTEDHCRISCLPMGSSATHSVPLRRNIFRSLLARFACLCSEQSTVFVSPYGDEAEFERGSPPKRFRINFSNDNRFGYSLTISPAADLTEVSGVKEPEPDR